MATGGANTVIQATSGPEVNVKPLTTTLQVLPHLLVVAALGLLKVVGEVREETRHHDVVEQPPPLPSPLWSRSSQRCFTATITACTLRW
jgi:hypothetical protein